MSVSIFEVTVVASPEAAFQAFVNESLLRAWVCDDAKTNERVNGVYQWIWNHGGYAAGVYKTVTAGKQLDFTWFSDGSPSESSVSVSFAADGDKTHITVKHTFPDGDGWAAAIENLSIGWRDSLDNLVYLFETGLDRRFMTRPMFGVYLAELTDEYRAEHGISLTGGVVINDVMAGGPADQAGFKKNDILVKLGDAPINNFPDLQAAQRRYRGGDTLKVELVNAGESRVVDFTFGQRPTPELGKTPDELAMIAQTRSDRILGTLADFIRDVPEEHLARRPAPQSWSVNDQLAHMILSERISGIQTWDAIGGAGNFPWGGNNEMHLAGLKAVHPTGAALFAELRRALDEHIAMLRAIPEAAAQNRALMGQTAFGVSLFGSHIESHFNQIQEAIESAREVTPA